MIEIATKSKAHRTSDGLGLSNFLEPKYSDRFDRWIDGEGDSSSFRFILKGGGLALYSSVGDPIAVVYSGDVPMSVEIGKGWKLMED